MIATELLRENPSAERAGDPRGDLGQPLPLHGLPGHRRRDPARGVALKARKAHGHDSDAPWIGKDIPRLEDPRAADRAAPPTPTTCGCPGMLHAAVLRSPHAHARIVRDRHEPGAGAARRLRGGHGRGRRPRSSNPLPALLRRGGRRSTRSRSTRSATPARRWRAVAAIDRYTAEDARDADRGRVRAARPSSTDPLEAMKPGAPLVHENLGSNLVFEKTLHASATSTGDFASRRPRDPPHAALASRAAPSRWRPRARSAASTRRPGGMDVWSNTNMINYVGWLVANTLEGGAEQARTSTRWTWAAASAPSTCSAR